MFLFLMKRGIYSSRIINGGDIRGLDVMLEGSTVSLKLHHDSGIPPQARYRFYLIGYSEGEVAFQESYMLFDRKKVVRLQGDYFLTLQWF